MTSPYLLMTCHWTFAHDRFLGVLDLASSIIGLFPAPLGPALTMIVALTGSITKSFFARAVAATPPLTVKEVKSAVQEALVDYDFSQLSAEGGDMLAQVKGLQASVTTLLDCMPWGSIHIAARVDSSWQLPVCMSRLEPHARELMCLLHSLWRPRLFIIADE